MSDSNRGERNTLLEALLVIACLVFAAFVIFSIGNWFGVEAGRDQVSAREHYEQAKSDALLSCSETDLANLRECVTKAIESANEQSNSRQDLYAQMDMAWWALVVGLSSVGTLCVTALGVFYVRDTLFQAVDAAKAANDTNRIMRDEQRPWLKISISDFEMLSTGSLSDIKFQIRAKIDVENFGKNPAIDVWSMATPFFNGRGIIPSFAEIWKIDHPKTHFSGLDQIAVFPGEVQRLKKFGVAFPRFNFEVNQKGIAFNTFLIVAVYFIDQSGKQGLSGRVFLVNAKGPFRNDQEANWVLGREINQIHTELDD